MLLRLSVRVEWRDALLIEVGNFSLLNKFSPLKCFLRLERIDPDDEDANNFFEYLSWDKRLSIYFIAFEANF